MTRLLIFVVVILASVLVEGQGPYWAYDPYTGHTYQTYGGLPATSSGLAKKSPAPGNSFYNNWPTYPVHSFQPTIECKPAAPPKIDWGICPMLEATEEDKKTKEDKEKECIKDLELNENTTMADLSPALQNRVRECVLRKDGLINEAGKYNYDTAMDKLKAKGIPEELGKKVEESHVECKVEAARKFLNSNQPLAEVESYQECMDFHLALMCKIRVKKTPNTVGQVNSFHGIPGAEGQHQAGGDVTATTRTHSHDMGDVMDKIKILSQALRR